MHQSPKFRIAPIAAAVATALSAVPVAYTHAQEAVLEEIIVTSRKRAESVMDIPASIQAISQETLKDMGARGINDYSRFVPSVNVVTYATGSNVIVFRGANVDSGGYVAQSTSSVYLDEISLSNTGEQPAVRMVDIARVEALAGPQGTLYGSDAQAGTMRIITNKPVMNEFEIVTDLSGRTNDEGADSHDGSIVLNLPLVEDTLALRLVGFTAKDGGYIDNVFGHTADTDTSGAYIPAGFGTLDNAEAVKDDWNEAKVDGWRAALQWDISENWTATFTALSQEVDAGAPNYYDPFVGDLEIVHFNDEYRKDEYDMYSFVLEADLGFAQLVAATSYFERTVDEYYDQTTYHHAWSAAYCQGGDPAYYYWQYEDPQGNAIYNPVYCNAPTIDGDYLSAYIYGQEQDRFTQEIRLQSQGDTIDWLAGFFYEESNNDYYYDFAFPTKTESNPGNGGGSLYQESISLAYFEWYNDTTYPNATAYWGEDSETTWEQSAIFGEVVWHAGDRLDITFGGRYFDRTNDNRYWESHPTSNTAELDAGPPIHSGEETQFIPKIAASYTLDNNGMVYALWTEGYRPGGTNRSRGEPTLPQHYDPDKMTNWEAGYKTNFSSGAGRLALTAFLMDWEEYQLEIVDPSQIACPDGGPSPIAQVCGQPWQNVVANAGDASITGVSIELDYAVSNRFVLGMNAEWLDAQTETSLDLNGDGEINVPSGQRLPITPDWTGAAWANYSWPVSAVNGNGFARLQWSYTGETISNIQYREISNDEPSPQFTNDAFDIADFSIGLENDTWEATLFVNNLMDERANYQHSWGLNEYTAASVQDGRPHTQRIYTNRPRELGVRFIYRWGD